MRWQACSASASVPKRIARTGAIIEHHLSYSRGKVQSYRYVGFLRCRSWHSWPAPIAIEQRDIQFYDGDCLISAQIAVLSYTQRTSPELYPEEKSNLGPLLWDGKVQDLHTIRDVILKAPEDVIPVTLEHRQANRGEVDVCIHFYLDAPITAGVVETVKAIVFSAMAMINLRLADHLVPILPFQVSLVTGKGQRQTGTTVMLSVCHRKKLEQIDIRAALHDFGKLASDEKQGERVVVALELYAAHFAEKQARVRFLLLVIALEAVAVARLKHETALLLLDKWDHELNDQLRQAVVGTEEHNSLEALRNSLRYQRTDSIRSSVQNLFTNIAQSPGEEQALRKRARVVYDKRSTLVHEGRLPAQELSDLEDSARNLLELVFSHFVSQTSGAQS
jgi:hypothetical protein